MRHVLSALVQNVPGVLAHVAGMFASRGYNIDSLAVGETEDPHLSRMTFVVVGDDSVLEQVRKQLEKIVTVVQVDDVSAEEHVERDLMLIKVTAAPGKRSEILITESKAAVVDGAISGGAGGGLLAASLLRGSALDFVVPVADSVVASRQTVDANRNTV